MKCNLSKSVKIGLIVTLCLIVIGMVFFGVFGFNKSVDNRTSYQVIVSVDQDIDGEGAKVKETAEKYFDEVGVKVFNYQEANEGSTFIYNLKENKVDAKVLKEKIQQAVGDSVVAECSLKKVVEDSSNQVVNTVIALSVALVVIFVYLLIVNKLVTALTVIFNAIYASILAIALFALTRIPVFGAIEIYVVSAFVLSAILSVVIASRAREVAILVGNEKLSKGEVITQAIKDSMFRLLVFIAIVVVIGIVLASVFTPHFIYSAIHVLIAGVCALVVSVIGSYIFWSILKTSKK